MPSASRLAVGGVAVLGGALATAVPAHADYAVWSCRGPDGTPVATTAWTAAGGTDDCAAGGALRATLAGPGAAGGEAAGYRLALPAGVRVQRARVWVTARTAPSAGGLAAPFTAGTETDAGGLRGCTGAAAACAEGDPATPLADANLVDLTGAEAAGLQIAARCTGSLLGCAATAAPAAEATLQRSRIDVVDVTPPVVSAPTGTAFDAGARSGAVTVAADLADAGGGVRSRALVVDDRVVATLDTGGGCAEPYTTFTPCPATQRAAFTLDTTTLADGPHTVGVAATDAAGLTSVTARRVEVRNAPVVTAAPARVPARIALPRRIALPHSGPITGRVYAADGLPLAGIRVRLQAKGIGQADARLRDAGTAVTDATGTFPVGTAGESRVVRTSVAGAAAQEVRLVSRLRLTVRKPRGTVGYRGVIRLTGRLRGAGPTGRGKPVRVQVVAGGRWRTVAKLRAGAGGAIRWRYRLRNTTQPSDFRFRVVVPAVKGQPWARVVSRPVVVRVRAR